MHLDRMKLERRPTLHGKSGAMCDDDRPWLSANLTAMASPDDKMSVYACCGDRA